MTRSVHQPSLVNRSYTPPSATVMWAWALVALCALSVLMASCAQLAPAWSSPTGTPIYVAPMADLTPAMAQGGALQTLVTEQLYARAPRRFMLLFDDHALALDVAVVTVDDIAVGDDQADVVVTATVRLVDRAGHEVLAPQRVTRRGRYRHSSDPAEQARRRLAATVTARHTLAGAIVDQALAVP